MSNTPMPLGFYRAPSSVRQRADAPFHRYYIPAADTAIYRVGDAVASTGGADANGVIAVGLPSGSGAVRGVILAVEPASPTSGLAGLDLLQVPASKSRDYYVWVDDDPQAVFLLQDDGAAPGNSTAANSVKSANFTPNTGVAGLRSATTLSSASIGSSGSLKLLGLAPIAGNGFGAYTTWVVTFAQHELAGGATGTGTAPAVVAPTITSQPSAASVTAPATATFTVAATGGGTLTYQWQRNGANISGATSASYTTPATTVTGGSANNGDAYRCVVTNSAGSVTSNAVTLTVAATGLDTRPGWFAAPSTAATTGTAGFVSGRTTAVSTGAAGTNGGKAGQYTLTTTGSNYAWFAINNSGSVTFTDVSSGLAGGFTERAPFTDGNGTVWRLFQSDYPGSYAGADVRIS